MNFNITIFFYLDNHFLTLSLNCSINEIPKNPEIYINHFPDNIFFNVLFRFI